ncbi:MAG: ABC transporter substrate-binding protein [Candidatus Cryptobacteroides sp.]
MYFRIIRQDGLTSIITSGPGAQSADTFSFPAPCSRIVCMSANYAAYLSALGRADAISAVSGTGYVSDTLVRRLISEGKIAEAGYDTAPAYETIFSLRPDVVVTYSLQSAGNEFISMLRRSGIPVLVLQDYLEHSPLARAEYIRVFGALTGENARADSIYSSVASGYRRIASAVEDARISQDHGKGEFTAKVLMNIPYSDAWYVPGEENYMSRLVRDAGGAILGAVPGKTESSVISVEQAFSYSKEADFWLNPGWCLTKEALYAVNPVFRSFGIGEIYNNILRRNSGGGNDFWESGALRPDLILSDLVNILHPGILPAEDAVLNYYLKVE